MNSKPNISESEWIIMKTLWQKNPQTANDIVETLSESVPWKPKTIKTRMQVHPG